MPWISQKAWDAFHKEMAHRVTHDAGTVNRLVNVEKRCAEVAQGTAAIAESVEKLAAEQVRLNDLLMIVFGQVSKKAKRSRR